MERLDRVDPVTATVGIVAVLALLVRGVGLGGRPFHWDEARVGVLALHLLREGLFEYRPVAGGPLPVLLSRTAIALLGPTDAATRLPITVLTGLLPLSALLLRSRLRDGETVVLAVVLALSPPLVYYGRFLRGDLLLAGSAFLAVVFGLRALEAGRPRFVYASSVAVAASLAASGFVVGTVACLLGGLAVVLSPRRVAHLDPAEVRARLRTHRPTFARAVLLGTAVVVFLFAPRGAPGASLWAPTTFPGVLAFVFEEAPARFFSVRIASRWSSGTTHELLPYVRSLLGTLGAAALPTLALAVAGALHERYLGDDRAVVTLFAVWGGLGVVVFPAIAEVDAPWTAVHVLVPLSVPAAVGGGLLIRYAARALGVVDSAGEEETTDAPRRESTVSTDPGPPSRTRFGSTNRHAPSVDVPAVAAVLLLVVAVSVQVGGVLATEVYGQPTPDSTLAQYAQPADPLDTFAANVSVAADGSDPAVLYYGDRFHTTPDAATGPPTPGTVGGRLPLSWYVAASGGDADSLRSAATVPSDPPPVVVTDVSQRGRLSSELDGYRSSTYRLGLWNREVVVFVRR